MKSLKIIFRRLLNQRLSTSLVLISFSIAFCCAILVYLFVTDEFAFDKYNTNFSHIYRLNIQSKDKSNISCSFPAVYYDKIANVPGVEKYARIQTFLGERFISINNTIYTETSFLFADPEILDLLKFDFLLGNPKEALAEPFRVIITQSIAKKYFGDENPLGKIINADYHDFIISGVVKDLPKQSHLTMNFLASVSSYNTINSNLMTKWYISAFNYYFIFPERTDIKGVEAQLTKGYAEGNGIANDKIEFEMKLEPLSNIHLKSTEIRWDNAIKGDIKIVYGFIVIALLILGIAIANYINALTANYRRKSKETSIRRVHGAPNYVIIIDQAIETFILFSFSMVLANYFAFMLLPIVNNLSGKSLALYSIVFIPELVLVLLSTLFSIIYPIAFMNSFKPLDLLKNQIRILKPKNQQRQQWVRGSLVTFQLIIATILIISTLVVNKQLQFVLKTKVGFDKENTLIVNNPYTEGMDKRYDLFKEKLLSLPMVKSVGVTQNAPGGYINNFSPAWLPDQKDQQINIGQITVDQDFLRTVGANFVDGRDFNINLLGDKNSGMIINLSAAQALKLEHPVGSKIVVQNNAYTPNDELEVIGVIEDMQYFTLRESAKPVMYYIRDWGKQDITIKLAKGDYSETLKQVKNLWQEIEPVWPISYQFMDERISANYKSEINIAKIISSLSGIAIFLSILGILGMIIFTTQQRTKEIGIRKVNGAKISEIVIMLNRDFIKWVAIAFVIAVPIAWYIMNRWLQNFAYKIELSWWIFALAGLIAFLIALITVSWQTFRAARRNPIEALRYE